MLPRLLTEKEVAGILTASVSKLRRNRWLGQGIPYMKNGRLVRYREDDVIAFVERNRVETGK